MFTHTKKHNKVKINTHTKLTKGWGTGEVRQGKDQWGKGTEQHWREGIQNTGERPENTYETHRQWNKTWQGHDTFQCQGKHLKVLKSKCWRTLRILKMCDANLWGSEDTTESNSRFKRFVTAAVKKSDISWGSSLFKSSPRPLSAYECSFSSKYPRTTQTIDPYIAVTRQTITIAQLLSNKNPSGINCSIHSQDGRWLKYVLTFHSIIILCFQGITGKGCEVASESVRSLIRLVGFT